MMCDMCEDGRFEIIEAYKRKLIEATNIETSPEEMAVIDNILFRFWQMGWLSAAQPESEERMGESAQNVPKEDLISRKAALDAIEAAKEIYVDRKTILAKTQDIINNLPSAHPERRWIPTEEALPDEWEECWITPRTTPAVYKGVFTRRYGSQRDIGFICCACFMQIGTALAWMPRDREPEPYEGGEQDG